ncbi:sigma-70 family RNA polymerase sigma factor [Chitinophaga sp. XS-30]|uniref:sigma-70 family RNA polymerase sigma factor n=1 Tax=Chitinophaga sp. XS-30 TaxID=2604421 RepID=UPI0011DDB694|nr:sigma-70 family RNA polymerase sigma factor [Chitinophaga sp. XS-30]QEH43639.1 sigma-70 family RNA polymerase sigma factor [Chitinophaga sp. XS-30]
MKQLAVSIKEGDRSAFDRFYHATYPKAMAYLSKMLFHRNAQDDIIQEAYIRLWLHRGSVDENQSIESYFFTILRNTIFNYLRKQAVDRKRMLELDTEDETPFRQYAVNNAMEGLYAKEFASSYHAVLQKVSPVRQRCFRLHREQGMTYREIALQEGIHIRTVERYISDTLQFLRENLLAGHYLVCSLPSCLMTFYLA